MTLPLNAYQALIFSPGTFEDADLPPLPGTLADAEALTRILIDKNRCGYAPEQVHHFTAERATLANLRAGLRSLGAHPPANATTLIYISTHGGHEADDASPVFLCTRDTRLHDIAGTTLSSAQLSEYVAAIKTQRVVVIIDACFAGGAVTLKGRGPRGLLLRAGITRDVIAALGYGGGRVALASSRHSQPSQMTSDDKMSLFTHHLVAGLDGGADVRGDGFIRILDLFSYIADAMKDSWQEPILSALNVDDNFPVALAFGGRRKGIDTRPSPIDTLRQQLLRDPAKGIAALQRYVAGMSPIELDGRNVDPLKLDALIKNYRDLESDIIYFGQNQNWESAKYRLLYELLVICKRLEDDGAPV